MGHPNEDRGYKKNIAPLLKSMCRKLVGCKIRLLKHMLHTKNCQRTCAVVKSELIILKVNKWQNLLSNMNTWLRNMSLLNLSAYSLRVPIFKGGSLSRSHIFTHSLTRSFTILQKIDLYYMSYKAKHCRVKST